MTCICWDGKTLAADRKATGGQILNVQKIARLPDGSLLAACGYYEHFIEVVRWLESGGREDDKPKFDNEAESSHFMFIDTKGRPFWLTWPWMRKVPIAESFIAFGSGGDYAMGAMAMGASAKRAVAIACQFDLYCGKGIDVFRVKKT